jgi:hypothetical protein
MNLLDFILPYNPPPTGCLDVSAEWIASLPKHELFAGGAEKSDVDWASLAPPFRYQGASLMCTSYAMCSAGSMMEKKETGLGISFSPIELYVRSNGGLGGNTIQATADSAKNGFIVETDVPLTEPLSEWNQLILDLLGLYARAAAKGEDGSIFAIKNLTSVNTERQAMYQALKDSPLLAIVEVGRGYFDDRTNGNSGPRHAVVIEKVNPDGSVQFFDSLTQTQNFNGHHTVGQNFPIYYAFGLLDLPDDWKSKQTTDDTRGRSPTLEAQTEIVVAAARRANPTLASYFDRYNPQIIDAITYLGYSITDIKNHFYSIRVGKGPIWDITKPRI